MPGLFRHPPQPTQFEPGVLLDQTIGAPGNYPHIGTQQQVFRPGGVQDWPYDYKPDAQEQFWSTVRRLPDAFQLPPSAVLPGATRYLAPNTIISQQQVFLPTVVGGAGNPIILVGNIDRTANVLLLGENDKGAPSATTSAQPIVIQSNTLGRWTMTLDFYDTTGTFAPALGQTITFVESARKLFAGCIQDIKYELLMGTTSSIIYHVTATDKSGICDHRVITGKTYTAGTDIASGVIADIVNNYLNGEGITITPQSVPSTLGTLPADIVFNFPTVSNAFDQLCTLCGTVWGVDFSGVLFFNSLTNLPSAPYNITANSGAGPYRSLAVETTTANYGNKFYVVSNNTVLPGTGGGSAPATGSNTETFTFTAGQPGIGLDGAGNPFCVFPNLPVGTLYSVTINGHQQTVVQFSQWAGQEPNLPFDFLAWWDSNVDQVSFSDYTSIPSGATIVVNYTPYQVNVGAQFGEALAPINPVSGGTLGTCGSGLYEIAVQVHDVYTTTNLNAVAQAELNKRGLVPTIVDFETDQLGFRTGQQINVNLPVLYINNVNMMIIQVVGTRQPGVLGTGANDSAFRWQCKAQSNQDPGNWIQWFARSLTQSSNPLPVPRYEFMTFALAPGGSLSAGMFSGNPYIVQSTGRLLNAVIAAATPPTGQNLTIQFYVNNVAVPGAILSIAAGSSPNVPSTYTFPLTSPLYVSPSQIVSVKATYTVTGSNPLPASGVTARLTSTF